MDLCGFFGLGGEIQVRFLKVSEGKEWCTSSGFHLEKRTRKITDLLGKRHLHFMLAPVFKLPKILGKLAVLQLPSDSG